MGKKLRVGKSNFERTDTGTSWRLQCPDEMCVAYWIDDDKVTLLNLFHEHVAVVHTEQ